MTRRQGDRELVRGLIDGDEAAFDAFSEHHIPALYRFAAGRLRGDRELTKEVVQSTLCKAIAKLTSFRGEAALMTWLCACCRNEIAAHFRREQRAGTELEFEVVEAASPAAFDKERPPTPEGDLLRKEAADLVHIALDALPSHYSRALEWKYIETVSVNEIAGRLDVGPKAAESLLTRARQAFKDEYDRLVEALRPSREGHPMGTVTKMEVPS
jgi:RNA polymerase sigma-70 factor (ECF subfamily)